MMDAQVQLAKTGHAFLVIEERASGVMSEERAC